MTRSLKDKQQANGRTLALDGAAWRKLRASVLRGEPLCRHCQSRGLIVVATEVDHCDNDSTNDDPSNHQALCHDCHSLKTHLDQGHNVYLGCDVNGMPLDPSHPWNKEKSPATDSHQPTGYASFLANSNDLPKK